MNVKAETFDLALLEALKGLDKGIPRREYGYGITALEYMKQTGDKFMNREQAKDALDRLVKLKKLKSEKMIWEGKNTTIYTKAE